MISYCALAILAVLLGANAQSGEPPCSKQMELEHRCMLNIETSPEAQMIKDRMKQVKKTCVPDFPEECHAQFEAGHECAIEVAKSVDTDPAFQASKSQSQPAVDACFEKYPVDIMKGIMEIFMMGKPQHGQHGKHGQHGRKMHHHKRHHNQTSSGESGESGEKASGESGEKASGESGQASKSSSNETSASGERRHGGQHHGGKHHGGKRHNCRAHRHQKHNATSTSSEMKSNETSGSQEKGGKKGGKSSGGKSGGKSGSKGGKHQEMPQCRKTKEQKQCMKDEMKKLAKDSAFVDVINTLIHQKQKCKQIITWSCSPKCEKKRKCVFQATKPCRQVFMDKMKTCLAAKGFTLPPHMMKEHTHMFTTPVPDVTPQN